MSENARARRIAFAIVPLSAAALLVPGVSLAAAGTSATTSNAVMTGCLGKGTLVNVAKAKKPSAKCK
ncbi:MAG TPA: hypothetical protein VNC22_09265, partial [Sporichthya sp.]|nr:hypothetical protein [Sporichthya sp.]